MSLTFVLPLTAVVISAAVMEKREPGMIRKWLGGMRPLIAVHYLLPPILGIFLGTHMFGKPINYFEVFLLYAAIFFSFQTSVITNDYSDLKTDQISNKKSLLNSSSNSIEHITELGVCFFVISLLFAWAISYRMLLIVLLGHVLHFIYSAKPFRLKRFYPLSIGMLALGALLTAIAGYALFENAKPFLSFPLKATLFAFVPYFLALNFRDLSDYQGDKKTEITTLFTLLGLETGRIINAILVLACYVSVSVILQFPLSLIITMPLGIMSFYFCLKKPFQEKYVFYIYFVLIVILLAVFSLNPGIIVPNFNH